MGTRVLCSLVSNINRGDTYHYISGLSSPPLFMSHLEIKNIVMMIMPQCSSENMLVQSPLLQDPKMCPISPPLMHPFILCNTLNCLGEEFYYLQEQGMEGHVRNEM